MCEGEQRECVRGVGDKSGGETPGSISNPAVKSTSVDGSAGATLCESRPLPTLFSCYALFDMLVCSL